MHFGAEGHLSCIGFEGLQRNVDPFPNLRAFDEAEPQPDELGIDSGMRSSSAPYRGSFFLTPAYVHCNGRRRMVSLSMAAGYIYARLCRRSDTLLRERVPYCYIPGRNHGKRRGKHWMWDMRLSAGGKEGIVEELQRRTWAYERERLDSLLTQWDVEPRASVYRIVDYELGRRVHHVVFSDKQALERVRFRTFFADCRAIEQSARSLRVAIHAEELRVHDFIESAYTEATGAHLEKVVRIPEIYKIAM
jgi:hypothetical protein